MLSRRYVSAGGTNVSESKKVNKVSLNTTVSAEKYFNLMHYSKK